MRRTRAEYLLEYIRHGNSVKVCAVDPVTGLEVSIVGPANAGREALKRTAVAKLEYVLKKRRKKDGENGIFA